MILLVYVSVGRGTYLSDTSDFALQDLDFSFLENDCSEWND